MQLLFNCLKFDPSTPLRVTTHRHCEEALPTKQSAKTGRRKPKALSFGLPVREDCHGQGNWPRNDGCGYSSMAFINSSVISRL
jgi:hypothetical protein